MKVSEKTISQRSQVIFMYIGHIHVQKVKSVSKGTFSRGNHGQPGPTCP